MFLQSIENECGSRVTDRRRLDDRGVAGARRQKESAGGKRASGELSRDVEERATVDALRLVMERAMDSPDLAATLVRQSLQLAPTTGAEVERRVTDLLGDPAMVELFRAYFECGKREAEGPSVAPLGHPRCPPGASPWLSPPVEVEKQVRTRYRGRIWAGN